MGAPWKKYGLTHVQLNRNLTYVVEGISISGECPIGLKENSDEDAYYPSHISTVLELNLGRGEDISYYSFSIGQPNKWCE